MKIFTLQNVVLFFIGYLLWTHVVSNWIDINYSLPFLGAGTIENYGTPDLHYSCWSGHKLNDCEPEFSTIKECTKMAHAQCGTTDARLGSCWMPAFLKCSASSVLTKTPTDCHAYADAYCGGSPGECADCFSHAHKQCMGMGSEGCN